jgi:two-component system sensor histidine kinase RegB
MGSLAAEKVLEGLVTDWSALHDQVPLDASFGHVRGARIPGEPALRQALWSLLENAGEASPSGIAMRAEVEGEQLVVCVLDNGAGFAPEQIAAIGQASRSAKGAGHGLGLFLAASVARRLGGSLDAGNRPEGGASVRLALPLVGSERPA